MQKPIDFRKFATECARLAEEVGAIEDKAVLLSMAEVWIQLADKEKSIRALLESRS
jgi:hypothetical protein